MSGLLHKIEQKIEEALHLGHKDEDDKNKKDEHKPAGEYSGEKKAEDSHGEQIKEIMHKIKKKMGGGGHGKKKHHGEGKHKGEHNKEGEHFAEGEEEEEGSEDESESESESEEEEESGGGEEEGGGGFEFEF